jgi:hypothetical protein
MGGIITEQREGWSFGWHQVYLQAARCLARQPPASFHLGSLSMVSETTHPCVSFRPCFFFHQQHSNTTTNIEVYPSFCPSTECILFSTRLSLSPRFGVDLPPPTWGKTCGTIPPCVFAWGDPMRFAAMHAVEAGSGRWAPASVCRRCPDRQRTQRRTSCSPDGRIASVCHPPLVHR